MPGDAPRPALDLLLGELGVAVPVRHAVSGVVSGPASPIQAAALPDAVTGRDLLAVAPTGSGKTLVFAVGLVHHISGSPSIPGRPRALVVSPTRELALQTDEVLGTVGAGAGIRIASFVGGQPLKRDRRSLIAPVDIAVGTPGRLVYLIRNGAVDCRDVRFVVLDEVDQLLEDSFRSQTEAILDRCGDATLMSTTATADRELEDTIRRRRPSLAVHRVDSTGGSSPVEPDESRRVAADRPGGSPAGATNPRHLVLVTTEDPESFATSLASRCRRALFFVTRRDAVEPLRTSVAATGVTAAGVSGSASPTRRATAFAELAGGKVRVLVTTDLAGRGLDLDDIGHIVNVGPPHSAQDLVHRSGRTGRGTAAAGTVAAIIHPWEAERVLALAAEAGMTVDRLDAGSPAIRRGLDTLFGPEITPPRVRRTPAPRASDRRPQQSRVPRPKKKRRA